MTEAERDVYRILRSFHVFAAKSSRDDFPVAQADLADRLGVSKQYVGQILAHFVACGILARTVPPVPHKAAARYRWLPPTEPPGYQTTITPSDLSHTLSTPTPPPLQAEIKPLVPESSSLSDVFESASSADSSLANTEVVGSLGSCGAIDVATPTRRDKLSMEVQLFIELHQEIEVSLAVQRQRLPGLGLSPQEVEKRLARMQKASERVVAAGLAYRIDADTVSMKCPDGVTPLNPFPTRVLNVVIEHGRFDLNEYLTEIGLVRGNPHPETQTRLVKRLVEVGILTSDYRLNPDPDLVTSA